MRALTSYPSNHVTRRLRNHLDHQETTTSRRGTSYQCSRASPPGCVKPLKSAPYMGNGLYLADLDIRSIETHHETSTELSRSSGGDDVASRSILPVHKRHSTPPGARNRQNRPRAWVCDYTLRALTSDPFIHILRRLVSYLDHQEATMSLPSPELTVQNYKHEYLSKLTILLCS